jgi:23S rRNA (pseudouridine1915-N3)-methyltransferase
VKIEMVAVDRLRAPWARAGVAEYLERIGRYVPVERKEVKAARGDDQAAVVEEGQRILRAAAIGGRDRLVALTPRGDALDSEAWAHMLDAWAMEGVARAVFVVGGSGGLAPDVLTAADRRLSLGPQTLSHELAQLVLCEQIYRASTILKGEPYHK